jgi:hypothetical protein
VIAGIGVVMTVFPALFAAVLVMGTQVAMESLSQRRLFGARIAARLLNPLLQLGWLLALAALMGVSIVFGAVSLFFTVIPGQP